MNHDTAAANALHVKLLDSKSDNILTGICGWSRGAVQKKIWPGQELYSFNDLYYSNPTQFISYRGRQPCQAPFTDRSRLMS
jgi:hypothetical protein